MAGKSLRCERKKGTDRYGRALARCFIENRRRGVFFSLLFSFPFRDRNDKISSSSNKSLIDIGEWMLRQGHAVSYLDHTSRYLEAEKKAREEQRGIWAGEFEVPRDWRERRRAEREERAKKEKEKKRGAVAGSKKKKNEKVKAKKKNAKKKK